MCPDYAPGCAGAVASGEGSGAGLDQEDEQADQAFGHGTHLLSRKVKGAHARPFGSVGACGGLAAYWRQAALEMRGA